MSTYVAEASPRPRKSRYPQIGKPADVARVCEPMTRYRQEVVRLLLLNAKNGVLKRVTIGKGTLDSANVHPRDVFREAIRSNAAGIILVHNHPSGDPEPSQEDRDLTTRLAKAADLMGIPLLDHVIVGRDGFVSLKERGWF